MISSSSGLNITNNIKLLAHNKKTKHTGYKKMIKNKQQDSRSKVNQIIHHFTENITTGHYQPGQRLVEQALSLELGISRGPIREAMRALSAIGLLDLKPGRGAQIKTLHKEDITQRFYLLEALGSLAITASGHHDLAYLKENISREHPVRHSGSFFSKVTNFYVQIACLNQNFLLADYISKLNLDYFSHHIIHLFGLDAEELDARFVPVQQAILSSNRDKALTEHQKWSRHIFTITELAD